MMVCPHDTASNPDRWFRVAQYLGQHLDVHFNLEISLDFADFRATMGKADLVYANATDTLKLVDQQYAAIARPSTLFDEVVFVSSTEVASPSLSGMAGETIASVKALMPTCLALHILKEKGIQPAGIANHESWTGVISAIWRGEAQYGLVYKDTYDELSEQGKGMVKVIEISQERLAFHNLLVGNQGLAKQAALQDVFLSMHHDENGREILQDLGIAQWVPTTSEELAAMKRIASSP